MFRNQYDSDAITWSPQGRLHQVEYAMEAVKQGSCAVGLKSSTHVVLLGLKRSAHELSTHQKKVLYIDDHIGCAIAGLTSDARMLSKFMRTECLHSKFAFETPMPIQRLVAKLGDKAQVTTQQYGGRPYGVGLLIGGFDKIAGPKLYQFCPSANFFDCQAMAIGSRSQSSRTYLERNLSKFLNAKRDELIIYGLHALRDSLPNNYELTVHNTSVLVVSANEVCKLIEEEEIAKLLSQLESRSKREETIEGEEVGTKKDSEQEQHERDLSMQLDE
ncbi:hypothetical protein Zmor_008881 [Zophobas morio]|jgi:20S proteasome subunit alpha 6|uniref:Proteasome subunit alpha type-1 n=1 Tax=Zophobas morio TaxID=2755281 RepID=A0AA38M011_9CUCU|nr:hypothetical protein Zmor_008881 [Zophobas morio]